ncbi:hypothetical protein AERO8C_160226 [Aeromonas veronii]|uniref:Uncharacterized protein n=1 Tax=Aeromonas veronii TaxID=654 RepID=A0A653KZ03_AERVE|nr:hypothetical protein AERO8C_160226 [Aeromonas veronii]
MARARRTDHTDPLRRCTDTASRMVWRLASSDQSGDHSSQPNAHANHGSKSDGQLSGLHISRVRIGTSDKRETVSASATSWVLALDGSMDALLTDHPGSDIDGGTVRRLIPLDRDISSR